MTGLAVTHMICDCDGVLVDSESVAAGVLIAELGARWPSVDIAALVLPLLGQRIEAVLASVAQQVGGSLAPDEVDRLRTRLEAACALAPMVAGVDLAFARIDLPKACASNSDTAHVRAILQRNGLTRFFDERLYCADQVSRPKPAPDVYLAAAQGFGVAPARCVVIEDSTTGVTAAVSAGMQVIGFVGGGHTNPQQERALRAAGARFVLDHMDALPELVASLSAT
jgi:beta-phosphoglucomutase-like phosphatase (HAD superfamily)